MATNAQRKAVREHRRRKNAAGVARFEVAAPECDKQLMRDIAKRLCQAEAAQLRAELKKALASGEQQEREKTVGAIWRALRASPLVGANLDFRRERVDDRDVDL